MKTARKLVRVVIGALILLVGLLPTGPARAADLAFPILFVPVYSQNVAIAGAFTDTRITVFNPSRCVGPPLCLATTPTALHAFFFDQDEKFVVEVSATLTPFDILTLTGPQIPTGTGTAILVNTLSGGLPIITFRPLAAVVEIGAKTAAANIADPAAGSVVDGTGIGSLFALTASEAQLIPARVGEFPRVEVSAGPLGSGVFFGPEFETVIIESCLTFGAIDNFIMAVGEKLLGDTLIPCTGLNSGPLKGPDLLIWTPDDGGLLGTPAAPLGLNKLAAGYNLLAIHAVGLTAGTRFHGQAFVVYPGGIGRQAYSYNMPANFFLSATQAPAGECATFTDCSQSVMNQAASDINSVMSGVCTSLGGQISCPVEP